MFLKCVVKHKSSVEKKRRKKKNRVLPLRTLAVGMWSSGMARQSTLMGVLAAVALLALAAVVTLSGQEAASAQPASTELLLKVDLEPHEPYSPPPNMYLWWGPSTNHRFVGSGEHIRHLLHLGQIEGGEWRDPMFLGNNGVATFRCCLAGALPAAAAAPRSGRARLLPCVPHAAVRAVSAEGPRPSALALWPRADGFLCLACAGRAAGRSRSQRFRRISETCCSTIVIPPMEWDFPVYNIHKIIGQRIRNFVANGNMLVLTGGILAVEFINSYFFYNIELADGNYSPGPYRRLKDVPECLLTAPQVLPQKGIAVTAVKKESLPSGTEVLWGTPRSTPVFMIKFCEAQSPNEGMPPIKVLPRDCPAAEKDGRPCSCGYIMYIGYNYQEQYPTRWDKVPLSSVPQLFGPLPCLEPWAACAIDADGTPSRVERGMPHGCMCVARRAAVRCLLVVGGGVPLGREQLGWL